MSRKHEGTGINDLGIHSDGVYNILCVILGFWLLVLSFF
jgi:hypothetical protein